MAMSVVYATVGGVLVEEDRGGAVTCYVSDTLGSVVKTTDTAGAVTSATTYWPFGEVRTSSGTNPSPWGFIGTLGYYKDSSLRLYIRARYYLASGSRWLTIDPLWPSAEPFGYCSSMPNQLFDPTGFGADNLIGCGKTDVARITGAIAEALNSILHNWNTISSCLSGECKADHPSPSWPTPPRGPQPPDPGSMFDCLLGYLQNDSRIKFHCCGFWNVCPCKLTNACAVGMKGPGDWTDVYLCGAAWDPGKCGPLHCTLIHELLHGCAGVGHEPDVFNCIPSIPGCENAKRYKSDKTSTS